jgi:DNA-binding transcriptional MocR family regulator
MQTVVAHELKEVDRKLLDELAKGRNVPSNLAESVDVSRQWATQRLQQMESAEYVRNVGRGVYELVEDPRKDSTAEEPPSEPSQPPAEDTGPDTTDDADAQQCREAVREALDYLEAAREQLGEERTPLALDDGIATLEGVTEDG